MKLSKHERRLLWFAFRAGYIEAHTHIQGGTTHPDIKPGDSPQVAAQHFAKNVVGWAEHSAQLFIREAEQRGIPQ